MAHLTWVRALALLSAGDLSRGGFREVLGEEWREEETKLQNFAQVRKCCCPAPVPPRVLPTRCKVMTRVTPASALCFLHQVQALMPVY